jgi:hypothetical protein
MNYEASHVSFSAQLFIMFPAPFPPRIYHNQLSILINFLTVLTLVHKDSQFNKHDKNITLLFVSSLLPWNWYRTHWDVRKFTPFLARHKNKSRLHKILNPLKWHHL